MKTFTMRDEEFICENCGKRVTKLNYTARDHCPYCLSSLHVDINPGERLCNCHGFMEVIGMEKGKKDEIKLVYKYSKCGMIKRNKMAKDDNYELLLDILKRI